MLVLVVLGAHLTIVIVVGGSYGVSVLGQRLCAMARTLGEVWSVVHTALVMLVLRVAGAHED